MTWNTAEHPGFGRAARAYAQVGIETGVASADAHRLVLMLFDGALEAIAEARSQMARRDTPAKGRSIGRALRIIDEGLVASLDEAAGGELAQQLRELYGWIGRRLALANLRNDDALLGESARLLGELREAWQTIAAAKTAGAQA